MAIDINKILHTAAASGLLMLGAISCDVAPDERFVYEEPVTRQRTVLLMDFTGQKCVNCPEAHEVMQQLVQQYGDTALITVSIHAGALATSVDRTNFERNNIGLMIAEGDAMNNAFGINTWPVGVVDRINAPGAGMLVPEWAGAVRDAVGKPAYVHIAANASLKENVISVDTRVTSTTNGDFSLQVWVLEDSIKARQETKQGRVDDYIHNNVLRYVAYDVKEGFPITLEKGVESRNTCDITVKYTDKERWNTANLSVVCFAFRGTEICNAVKTKIKPQ